MEDTRQESKPIPDPTTLTTEALHREINSLKDYVLLKVDVVDKKVEAERQLTDEKFRGVASRFEEGEKRAKEVSVVAKDAVDKAFEAAKETVREIKDGFNKGLESVNKRVDDLKERQDRGEGKSKGLKDGWGYVVGAISIIVSIVMVYIAVRR